MPAKYTIVTSIPDCDICRARGKNEEAYADAFIPTLSTWGNVCKPCFNEEGCQLGAGQGQEFKMQEADPPSQEQRIREKLKAANSGKMAFEDFQDIFEDRDPAEFL